MLYYSFFLSEDINSKTTATKPIETRAKTPINMVPVVQETNGIFFNIILDFYYSKF